jgi:hypothetical protein
MTKNIFFRIAFLFFLASYPSTTIQAQNGEFGGRLSLVYEQVRNFKQNNVYQSGGLQGEVFLGEGFFSLGYGMSFGKDSQNGFVFHMPLGVYLASYPISWYSYNRYNNDWYLWAALLLIILPESANFHFKLSNEFVISPYIAPAGIDYWKSYDGFDVWSPTFAAGIRLNVLKNNLNLSPFAGVKIHYDSPNWNQIQFGVMIGAGWN